MIGWELVHDAVFERVRRFAVPGGYLYQVELDLIEGPVGRLMPDGPPGVRTVGWGQAVFVPGDHR